MSESQASLEPEREWPSVSVVVATRDRPELLRRALAAILRQSYLGELDCVVVYDQSEAAPVPVEVPAGRRLRVVTNSHVPGLAGARNTGIAATSGALVAFCDDDDEWHPGKLTAQVAIMRRSDAEFVGSGVRIRRGDQATDRVPPATVGFADLVRDRVTALHPSTFVISRDLLARTGEVDEELPGGYGEDYDLLLRAARQAPIVCVEQPLVDVYWHEQSFFAERWQTIADALGYLLGKHPELTQDPRGMARIEGQIAFAEAALAHRAAACRSSWRALRGNPAERRAYLALAVAAGAVPATSVVRMANRRGRGI
jgi:glycosyltransferase involved in cell wall biosynthesis